MTIREAINELIDAPDKNRSIRLELSKGWIKEMMSLDNDAYIYLDVLNIVNDTCGSFICA